MRWLVHTAALESGFADGARLARAAVAAGAETVDCPPERMPVGTCLLTAGPPGEIPAGAAGQSVLLLAGEAEPFKDTFFEACARGVRR